MNKGLFLDSENNKVDSEISIKRLMFIQIEQTNYYCAKKYYYLLAFKPVKIILLFVGPLNFQNRFEF